MKNTHLCLLAGLFFASCAKAGYERIPDGVVVRLNQKQSTDVKLVRLEVVNDKIIHVSATPSNAFSQTKSLIIIPWKSNHTFSVQEKGDTVTVSTTALHAKVSTRTGEVSFFDVNGKAILCENKGGGKSFIPIEVEKTKGYTLRQVFESATDEAFYGLGQHQEDIFNYKGKNESLFQYNTKVSVPFIISNKNYGVLWDNYSLSRFGDERDYAQLNDVFTLYDAEGEKGGLTATYVPSPERKENIIVRKENSLCYEDIQSIKNLPQGFPLNGANVTYQGELEANEDGCFRFQLYYAGYIKVYADGQLIVPERWRTAWNPNSYQFSLTMKKGKHVPIRIEWKPDGAVSYCGLRVLTPVPEKEQQKLALFSEMGDQIDYYFVYGHSMDEVISGYRTLTGKAPIMPKWAMGYWQSRERYRTQKEMLGVLSEFRGREIPIDNIILDWNYWPENAWGSHGFDRSRFPDPKGMVDSIHAMHARMMISVWPKFYITTEHYKEFNDKGWMYQQAVKDSIRDWVGPGYVGSFYDAYNADARKLFWKQMQDSLYSLGIDAWWMDASEPNVRDCTDMDYRKKLCGPTALGPSTKYFNAYALMNAEAIYDGQRGVDPDKRVFLLTRSGFAGLQRYSTATWSGDIASRWEDMKAQISAGINFSMSGIPYWSMDIGGFCVEKRYERGQSIFNQTGKENADEKEWRELNTRWYQFGAFVPLFRAHGQFPYREVWNIAPETHPAYQSIVYYTKLRYNLMPYIYSLAGMTYFDDYTIMRGLVMDFGADTKVNNIGDQYMFGPAFMVCPVYKYTAREREVYFPSGCGWYDFYTGKYISGGQQMSVKAPYERMPLYVREGAIIPIRENMQYTDEKPSNRITLYVYAGQDGSFTLYEDEGVNYNYEKGKYASIPLSYDEAEHSLTIDERQGEFSGMLKRREFNMVMVSKEKAQSFDLNALGKIVVYTGEKLTVKL
ncbi:TIM-barrel domain-containing protein [uncultured Bacteroides sp.]|uniref:TIM-barrel domain-containing protein n=1 Tax=uncultured Bacteroides sp. TaxID=162156 RepID=UPI002AAB459A|nr:TIM-barrel domain-containing protein [uncultured Bacteroides sp.]